MSNTRNNTGKHSIKMGTTPAADSISQKFLDALHQLLRDPHARTLLRQLVEQHELPVIQLGKTQTE